MQTNFDGGSTVGKHLQGHTGKQKSREGVD